MTISGVNNRLGAYTSLAYPCVVIRLQFGVWSPASRRMDDLLVLNRGCGLQEPGRIFIQQSQTRRTLELKA